MSAMDYDLVIKGGTVATASDTFTADVGIRAGKVAALGLGLEGSGDDRRDRENTCFPAGSRRIAISPRKAPPAG